MMTCQECGSNVADSASKCWRCGIEFEEEVSTEPKEVRVMKAKIAAKEIEYENANGYGPTICVLIGIFGIFVPFAFIFLIGGIVWAYINAGARDKVRAEINVMKIEME